jgi:hypothetical protein
VYCQFQNSTFGSKAKIRSKINIGNPARKLDFPLGNGDGLQESAGCVGHMLNTSSKVGHMTSVQKCQHHVSTDNTDVML